ncbi:DUF4198 domain-containing protein [Desulfotalea psychrophila]|uniref:DUF4198 domain-containing protein n=1 Tax=Desulfotalea psychrophila (strain LSv54 / DSM 12343) TaxID=177439 RepID=Q6ARZ0_DESPS|nr:DUF4198 domain-containing protein [Desulfotalea psychrophila]CAG34885.1 hypothetical protein DP0156 [Desulfotalea psychrophila LSv54]
MKKAFTSLTFFCATLLFLSSANAHEFIVKPVQFNVPVDHKLPFNVISCHAFMISEEAEAINQVEVALIKGDKKTKLSLQKNDTLLTLDGTADIKEAGTSILVGHRHGITWTQTTTGWKQASKKKCKGVISSGKYEKFCKTLINAGKADNGYSQILGQQLEIVPISNPAKAIVGKEMSFQILADGKPLSTKVYATYDGFSNRVNTYAYFTETDDSGIAHVQITHAGTWMLRVEHIDDKATADYDKHILRAVLVFSVTR